MGSQKVIQNLSEVRVYHRKAAPVAPPHLGDAIRFPYGAFRFRTQLPKGTIYVIVASTDVQNSTTVAKGIVGVESLEFVDSEAYKFSSRFYRVMAGDVHSQNVL